MNCGGQLVCVPAHSADALTLSQLSRSKLALRHTKTGPSCWCACDLTANYFVWNKHILSGGFWRGRGTGRQGLFGARGVMMRMSHGAYMETREDIKFLHLNLCKPHN